MATSTIPPTSANTSDPNRCVAEQSDANRNVVLANVAARIDKNNSGELEGLDKEEIKAILNDLRCVVRSGGLENLVAVVDDKLANGAALRPTADGTWTLTDGSQVAHKIDTDEKIAGLLALRDTLMGYQPSLKKLLAPAPGGDGSTAGTYQEELDKLADRLLPAYSSNYKRRMADVKADHAKVEQEAAKQRKDAERLRGGLTPEVIRAIAREELAEAKAAEKERLAAAKARAPAPNNSAPTGPVGEKSKVAEKPLTDFKFEKNGWSRLNLQWTGQDRSKGLSGLQLNLDGGITPIMLLNPDSIIGLAGDASWGKPTDAKGVLLE